ncbi:hypothetical protein B0H13DRAFT_2322532 [Mycena leptocephala]|nr:hypothetical protein B0H13DRAFT_2322532 [Mycena leptocephala]
MSRHGHLLHIGEGLTLVAVLSALSNPGSFSPGSSMRGRKPRVVLSREQRAEVRYMIGQSFFVAQIAKIFEVCDATILKIIKNSRADNLAEDDALVSPLFRSIIAGAKAAATNKFRIALHGEHEQAIHPSGTLPPPGSCAQPAANLALLTYLRTHNLEHLEAHLAQTSLASYTAVSKYFGMCKDDIFWILQKTLAGVGAIAVDDIAFLALAMAKTPPA